MIITLTTRAVITGREIKRNVPENYIGIVNKLGVNLIPKSQIKGVKK